MGFITISKSNDSIKVRKVGKYILQKELGRGSVGTVWLSFHSGLGIPVAVKILKPHLIEEDPEFLERFIQEGRLAVSLHHKNIVRIFDAGKAGESYYLVMELLEGNDALHIIQHEGAFSVDKVLEIGCAVADALVEAHEHGVIHRDIKPDNIMITSEGKIKLADLGLAKKLGDEFSSTLAGTTIGTPNYMSPEQAMNSSEANPVSDIYSLGASLYHMLTGTLPFEGESIMAVMMKHANEPLDHPQERRKDLPVNICAVIMKMMDKNPAKRYQSCEEVLTALNKIRYAPTKSEKPKTMVLKTKKFKKPLKKIEELQAQREERKLEEQIPRKSPLIYIFAALLLLLLSLLIFFKSGKTDSGKENETLANTQSPATSEKKEAVEKAHDQKAVDLFNMAEFRDKHKDSSVFQDGVLEIKPRDSFYYLTISGNYGHCKINFEYTFKTNNSYGKIGLLRNEKLMTNLIISSLDNTKKTTGDIQLRLGTSPDYSYKQAHKALSSSNKELGEWNRLEIILDGKSLIATLNGTQVSVYTAEFEEGGMAILASEPTHILIRKFELIPLK